MSAFVTSEFVLTSVGANFLVQKRPQAGVIRDLLLKFTIIGPDIPQPPAEPATLNQQILWAAKLIERGYDFEL